MHNSKLTLYFIDILLTHQQQTAFEIIVGKGEIARKRAISPFPAMFSTQADNCIPICPYFCHHLFAAELEEPKIGISGKGLTIYQTRKFQLCLKLEGFADDNFSVVQMGYFSLIGKKTLWEMEKMLVSSIFSFSNSVFKKSFSKRCQKLSMCGEELKAQ